MKKLKGKLILIDDELYERELFKIGLEGLDYIIDFEYFNNAPDALEYLRKIDGEIFLIISDMSMPTMTGLDLKKAIDADDELKGKAIPFIFASNSILKDEVAAAYAYGVQGYFKKPPDMKETSEMLETIIRYWMISKHPNNVK
jgi:CheY-like chemotaxis protein